MTFMILPQRNRTPVVAHHTSRRIPQCPIPSYTCSINSTVQQVKNEDKKESYTMKSLEEFLAEKREITIHTLAIYIRQYIREHWQVVLQEKQDELRDLFDKAGEPAYGVYGRSLFHLLQEQLKAAGFACEPDFPGDFRSTSVEYWGPPEERERCFWCVVRTDQGMSLGTVVTQIFHDHTQFRLPAPG